MGSSEQPAVYTQSSTNSFTNNFKGIFSYLLKKWWLFCIVGLIGGIIGFVYAANQEPSYKSRLTFALDEGGSGGSIGGFASLASQFGLNIGASNDIFAGENIIEIMKSRRMVEGVLLSVDSSDGKKTTLIEHYLNFAKDRKKSKILSSIHYPAGVPRTSFSYQQDSLLKVIYNELVTEHIQAAKPDRKLNIFEVNVTSTDEKFSKVFTDRLVDETNKFYIDIRTKKAKETLTVLESSVAAMKGNLNSSISGRAAVLDANLNPAFSAAQVPVQKAQANIQVYSAAYGEMFKNLEIARFQYLNEIPLMQIIDHADYPMQKLKMGKLKTAVLVAIILNFFVLLILWVIRIFKTQ